MVTKWKHVSGGGMLVNILAHIKASYDERMAIATELGVALVETTCNVYRKKGIWYTRVNLAWGKVEVMDFDTFGDAYTAAMMKMDMSKVEEVHNV